MATRVPVVEHCNLRTANSYIVGSLHDLNADDITGRAGGIGGDVDDGGDGIFDGSLDNDEDSAVVVSDCLHDKDKISRHHSGTFPHLVEVSDNEADYSAQTVQDKLNKSRSREIRYEGDARFVLPLMYVTNTYETLVNEVNLRLSSLNGMREKTIDVALEAAGGLYRKLAKKFPRQGPCIFKRRELAASFETRSRFPELVTQEEKRVRFVAVNGLAIVEKPANMRVDDAERFKRMTGQAEVAVSARDYKFYAPRHKYRRVTSNFNSTIPGLPTFLTQIILQQWLLLIVTVLSMKVHSRLQQNNIFNPCLIKLGIIFSRAMHPHHIDRSHHAAHYSHNKHCGPPSQLSEIAQAQQSSTISQHMTCLPALTHVGSRLHVLPTSPAKFCDECGAPHLRETSKFCPECGTKRLGI
ncbi:hypothetical protein ACH5RR_018584 [Cinchona calisaya]|uniref:Zinc-ribbon domain-containing protein n=1 Tax=Cinchona calisaya TaxID=153742 RepID=A0ABD2ZQ01_9GENT